MTTVDTTNVAPVKKSVTVKASAAKAFDVFTSGFDTWWPRSHHIGESPLATAVIEAGVGGRCYGRSVDGSETVWGRVTAWEPPRRFVFAWLITPEWKCQSDLAQASEVEVTFTPLAGGGTRVDLEHRHFERHGAGAEAMRKGVDSEGGWGALLQMFAGVADKA